MGSWFAGRRLAGRTLVGVLVAVGLVAAVVFAITRPPQTSPQPSGDPSAEPEAPVAGAPISARVVRNDIVLTLSLDHARAMSGTQLQARIEIANTGPRPVSWTSGGCRILNGFSLNGPQLQQPPPGRAWQGVAGLAKWSATFAGVGQVGFADARAVDAGPPFGFSCPADLGIDDIAAGQTLTADVVWPGRASDGQPAPGGMYRLAYEFPYLASVAKEQFNGDLSKDRQPIRVELVYRIDAAPAVVVPSTIAFDAALADPRVAQWTSAVTREQLYGATVGLVDGLWRIRIDAAVGAITVLVDPLTGAVRQVDARAT